MRLMTERRFRHVPVLVGGTLAGIVSIGDVVKHRIDELQAERDQLTRLHHRLRPDGAGRTGARRGTHRGHDGVFVTCPTVEPCRPTPRPVPARSGPTGSSSAWARAAWASSTSALDAEGHAVAVKVLRAHVAADPDARRRLAREVATPPPGPAPARGRGHRRRRRRRGARTSSPASCRAGRWTRTSATSGPLARGHVRRTSAPCWPTRCARSTTPASSTATSSRPTSCCSTASRC